MVKRPGVGPGECVGRPLGRAPRSGVSGRGSGQRAAPRWARWGVVVQDVLGRRFVRVTGNDQVAHHGPPLELPSYRASVVVRAGTHIIRSGSSATRLTGLRKWPSVPAGSVGRGGDQTMACSAWPSAGTTWTGGWPATPSVDLGRQRGVADRGTAACARPSSVYLWRWPRLPAADSAGSPGTPDQPRVGPALPGCAYRAELHVCARTAGRGDSVRPQPTDRKVNEVTPVLFARYRTAADYAMADQAELEKAIEPTGFYHAKANTHSPGPGVVRSLRRQCSRHAGRAVTLPGVGRKTANMVLGDAFGKPGTHGGHPFCPAGTAVWLDGLHRPGQDRARCRRAPARARSGLRPRTGVTWHGRRVCHARTPACGACGIARLCPSFGLGPTDEVTARKLVKTGPFS